MTRRIVAEAARPAAKPKTRPAARKSGKAMTAKDVNGMKRIVARYPVA